MTYTEYVGLVVLIWCLFTLVALLRWRRATTAQRRQKRAEFRTNLFWSALLLGFISLSLILPKSASDIPVSWQVLVVSLAFLVLLWTATRELRIAIRARNADDQGSPAGGDT